MSQSLAVLSVLAALAASPAAERDSLYQTFTVAGAVEPAAEPGSLERTHITATSLPGGDEPAAEPGSLDAADETTATAAILSAEIDSLYQTYNATGATNVKIGTANKIILCINAAGDSLATFAPQEDPRKVEILTNYYMGEWYITHSRFADAVQCGIKALDATDGMEDEDLLSDLYNLLSVGHAYMGNYAEALVFGEESLQIDKKHGDKKAVSSDLNTMAGLYLLCHDASSAKSYIDEAIEIEKTLDSPTQMAIRCGMAADIYGELGEYPQAMEFAREAFRLDSLSGNAVKAAVRRSQIAGLYQKQDYPLEAKEQLLKALQVLKENEKLHSLSIVYNQLGDLEIEGGKEEDARDYYSKALALSKSTGNLYIESKARYGLWKSLKNSDISAAAEQLEAYSAIKDTLFQRDLAHSLESNRVRYGASTLAEHVALERQRGKMILTISVIAVIFLILWIFILLYAYHIKNRAAKTLAKAEKMRTDFFTNITHEFRTPLTVILGYSKELNENTLPRDVSPQKAGEMIYAEGKGLLSLVTQLLDISKIRLAIGNPDWRHYDIVAYIRMIVEVQNFEARRKAISMTYLPAQSPLEMDFVPDYIRKVMNNLISNSIKFTPVGGKIVIRTASTEDGLQISVADTGIGIPKEDINVIFKDFYRGHNADNHMGTGIGLSMVKQIVEALGGNISVESEVGRGTEFTVFLPVRHSSTPLPPPDPIEIEGREDAVKAAPTGLPEAEGIPEVMIVEDNQSVMQLMGSILGQKYHLIYASNGEDATQIAKESIPDLIITDVMMPQMDGVELCRLIRSDPLTSHIPIIIASARCTDEDKVRGIKAGADAYIIKPFNDEELSSLAERLIVSRHELAQKYASSLKSGEMVPTLAPADKAFLDKLSEIVEELMKECKVDVEGIAAKFNITRKQLTKKVSAITGESTIDYVTGLRMKRACELLSEEEGLPIYEVAYRCGYEDNAYFSRIFSHTFKLSPSAWRKAHKG